MIRRSRDEVPGTDRQISPQVRSKIVALTRMSPPQELGISHLSSREMAKHLKKAYGIEVSHNFVSAYTVLTVAQPT